MARLLTREGDLVCQLEALEMPADVVEGGTPFSAIVSENAGAVIRRGDVLIETDAGTRYPGELDHAEVVVPDRLGPVVKLTGMIHPSETRQQGKG